jgi:hypothetical protein
MISIIAMETLPSILDYGQVIQAMENHPNNVFLQRDGCWLLSYLADSIRDELALQSRSFTVLVAAMNTFPEDERVLLGGCTAIMNVAGPRGGGRGKAARKAGSTDAVKMACEYFKKAGKDDQFEVCKKGLLRMNKNCIIM